MMSSEEAKQMKRELLHGCCPRCGTSNELHVERGKKDSPLGDRITNVRMIGGVMHYIGDAICRKCRLYYKESVGDE